MNRVAYLPKVAFVEDSSETILDFLRKSASLEGLGPSEVAVTLIAAMAKLAARQRDSASTPEDAWRLFVNEKARGAFHEAFRRERSK